MPEKMESVPSVVSTCFGTPGNFCKEPIPFPGVFHNYVFEQQAKVLNVDSGVQPAVVSECTHTTGNKMRAFQIKGGRVTAAQKMDS
jgi:hypothetical protein